MVKVALDDPQVIPLEVLIPTDHGPPIPDVSICHELFPFNFITTGSTHAHMFSFPFQYHNVYGEHTRAQLELVVYEGSSFI